MTPQTRADIHFFAVMILCGISMLISMGRILTISIEAGSVLEFLLARAIPIVILMFYVVITLLLGIHEQREAERRIPRVRNGR